MLPYTLSYQTPGPRSRVTALNDDPELLNLLRDLFEGLGYEVTTGKIALAGIQELIESRPDLIVIDIQLTPEREELTGLQTIHSARSSPALRDIPIIVSSADPPALADAWPDLMQRGDIHRLEKPFNLDTFERVVESAMGLAHGSLRTLPGAGQHLADAEAIDQGEQDG